MRRGHADNLEEALAALSSDELRAFVRDGLERLDDGPRGDLEDLLLQRAVRGGAGWKPAAPSTAIVADAAAFIAAARRVGHAEPSEVDDFLRQALTASLAGDHRSARAVFETVFEAVCDGHVDLGQHEMVDEVLSVDLVECVRRYLAAVYVTTPVASRAEEILDAIQIARELSYTQDPIAEVEAVVGGTLPDFDVFLPLWIACLEQAAAARASEWESDSDRWLRAAIGRRDGAAGLARLARATKRAEDARAWCNALVAGGDWQAALPAYDESASLVAEDYLRGEFLDGAALAAQVLGRKDLASRFEAAWLGAPSVLRLSRWLLAGDPTGLTLRKRAVAARGAMPSRSSLLIGLLDLLTGDAGAAAKALGTAPGLGWSQDGHPGHLLFAACAWLLGGAPSGSAGAELSASLHTPARSAFELPDPVDDGPAAAASRLPRPTLLDILQRASVAEGLERGDRTAMTAGMRKAAEHRADAVLEAKRRRHYRHAALLIACCVEVEGEAARSWAEAVRARTSRFPAFQTELRDALSRAAQSSAR